MSTGPGEVHVVDLLVHAVATASIAVAWHRLLLKDEIPRPAYLRADRVVLSYAVLAALILWAPMIPLLPMAMLDDPRVAIAAVIAGIAVAVVVARISLLLPARAIGRRDIDLSAAWNKSDGSGAQLFFGLTLAGLPLTGIDKLVESLPPGLPTDAIATALVPLVAAIEVGFLSLAYQHLIEEGPEKAPPI